MLALLVIAAGPPYLGEDALPPHALLRLGSDRYGGGSLGAALSPDGKRLAVADPDGLRLLDAATGRETRRWRNHEGVHPRFSPDGKRLAVVSGDEVVVLDADTGAELARLGPSSHPARDSICFSADGKLIALGADSDAAKPAVTLWSPEGKKLRSFKFELAITVKPCLSPDGKTLATWGRHDGNGLGTLVQLFDTATGARKRVLRVELMCAAVAFSPDGKSLALADGKSVILHDLATKKERRFDAPPKVSLLVFSPKGKTLAAGSSDGVVRMWETGTGKRLSDTRGPADSLASLAFLDEERAVAASVSQHAAHLWDVPSGKERGPARAHIAPVTGLAFSRDGKTLFTAGADAARSWKLPSGAAIRRQELPGEFAGDGQVLLSPDGRWVGASLRGLGGFAPESIRAVEGGKGRLPGLDAERDLLVAFSPDGALFAALTSLGEAPVRIRVRDARTGKAILARAPDKPAFGSRLALSPGGNRVAIDANDGTDDRVEVWGTISGKKLFSVPVAVGTPMLAFCADGTMLVLCGDAGIKVVDAGGEVVRSLAHPEGSDAPTAVAFSPEGRCLAMAYHIVGDEAGDVVVWELASGGERLRLRGHRGGAASLAFSPDGRTLATGGFDATALLWDVVGQDAAPGDVAALWKGLAGDAAKACRAMARLARSPGFVAFAAKELKRAAPPSITGAEAAKHIAALADESYDARQAATETLRRAGPGIYPVLKKSLAAIADLEHRKRVEALMALHSPQNLTPDSLRALRAVEVLERLATPEARRVLAALAKGAPGMHLTDEATAALRRMP
ncbi:MAG: hypothetical protein K2W96_09700 [Gemmataceae bacterium]|nr:hypothetical protein [Gemmataceae bacterium]